jgi:hypothetical protein
MLPSSTVHTFLPSSDLPSGISQLLWHAHCTPVITSQWAACLCTSGGGSQQNAPRDRALVPFISSLEVHCSSRRGTQGAQLTSAHAPQQVAAACLLRLLDHKPKGRTWRQLGRGGATHQLFELPKKTALCSR